MTLKIKVYRAAAWNRGICQMLGSVGSDYVLWGWNSLE
jgi:hypothetical protein